MQFFLWTFFIFHTSLCKLFLLFLLFFSVNNLFVHKYFYAFVTYIVVKCLKRVFYRIGHLVSFLIVQRNKFDKFVLFLNDFKIHHFLLHHINFVHFDIFLFQNESSLWCFPSSFISKLPQFTSGHYLIILSIYIWRQLA